MERIILFSLLQVVATNLWNYLGDDSPHYHQRAVDLLYQLHQLSPSSLICEDVIGSNLVSHEMVSTV